MQQYVKGTFAGRGATRPQALRLSTPITGYLLCAVPITEALQRCHSVVVEKKSLRDEKDWKKLRRVNIFAQPFFFGTGKSILECKKISTPLVALSMTLPRVPYE